MMNERIDTAVWQKWAANHTQSIKRWTEPFRSRRRVGQSHPVHDFLFVYYKYSPAKLECWHPGVELLLVDNQPGSFDKAQYSFRDGTIYCDATKIGQNELGRLNWIAELLSETRQRPGNYSCLGLHEWAMVYRGDKVRHGETTKLRLPQSEIDQLVESRPITCSHFDAFRFFADEARPLNRLLPTVHNRVDMEQPACIHTNMDLYKWAFKSMPWIGSKLLRSCFDLAMRARAVDMRASPYDLSHISENDAFEPIRIETAAGRAEYEQLQRDIAETAIPLRSKLIRKIERVIELTSGS